MYRKKRTEKDMADQAGAIAGNVMSRNVQAGTDMAMDSMEELLFKAGKLSKVGFEQSKGNLFEYIESAKLQTNMANKGHFFDKNPVTDIPESRNGFGGHTAPDDFRLQKNGKVIGQGQAKYNNSAERAARNFVDPKYTDMQRVAPVDQIKEIRQCLDEMVKNGEISRSTYQNAVDNLQYNGLTDPDSGISSGGTTTRELQKLRGADGKLSPKAVKIFAMKFEGKQLLQEVGTTSVNMAAMSVVSNGIVSGVKNMFEVFQNRKSLEEALGDVGADCVTGAARGSGTGALSAFIRFGGTKVKNSLLSDAAVSTIMAGGIIDGGVAVYEYAKGEITPEQLKDEIVDTTVKSVSTVYFMKAVGAVAGAANPFIPMAIYTAANYVVSCVRSVMDEAKLKAEEYKRMAALLQESTELVKVYHERLNEYMEQYGQHQRQILRGFMDSFEYHAGNGEHYEQAIYSVVNFANQMGIALQHTDFCDFRAAMLTQEDFILD